MPLKLRELPHTPLQIMDAEIAVFDKIRRSGKPRPPSSSDKLADIVPATDAQQVSFLRALSQAFQNTVQAYFNNSPDVATRALRLAEINQAFVDLHALIDQQDFSRAARSARFASSNLTRAAELPADMAALNDDKPHQIRLVAEMGQALQARLLQFHRDSPKGERIARLAALSQSLRELDFRTSEQDGPPEFTIAAQNAHLRADIAWEQGGEGCPEGTSCIDRNCIPNGDGDTPIDGNVS